MRRVSRWRASRAIALMIAISAAASAADTRLNALRIEVAGGSDDHGEIVFSFAEADQAVTRIPVAIPKGTPENKVARRIRAELRRALPKNDYSVDLERGEKILVSTKDGTRLFDINLVSNTVSGTEISIARE